MKTVGFCLMAFFAVNIAQAEAPHEPAFQMRCSIQVQGQDGVSSATMSISNQGSEASKTWSTALFVGKDPTTFTLGLSATTTIPDLLEAEIATGTQPEMAKGPGHALPGTLIETTRVHFDGRLTLIFDIPSLGITVVCDPFAP